MKMICLSSEGLQRIECSPGLSSRHLEIQGSGLKMVAPKGRKPPSVIAGIKSSNKVVRGPLTAQSLKRKKNTLNLDSTTADTTQNKSGISGPALHRPPPVKSSRPASNERKAACGTSDIPRDGVSDGEKSLEKLLSTSGEASKGVAPKTAGGEGSRLPVKPTDSESSHKKCFERFVKEFRSLENPHQKQIKKIGAPTAHTYRVVTNSVTTTPAQSRNRKRGQNLKASSIGEISKLRDAKQPSTSSSTSAGATDENLSTEDNTIHSVGSEPSVQKPSPKQKQKDTKRFLQVSKSSPILPTPKERISKTRRVASIKAQAKKPPLPAVASAKVTKTTNQIQSTSEPKLNRTTTQENNPGTSSNPSKAPNTNVTKSPLKSSTKKTNIKVAESSKTLPKASASNSHVIDDTEADAVRKTKSISTTEEGRNKGLKRRQQRRRAKITLYEYDIKGHRRGRFALLGVTRIGRPYKRKLDPKRSRNKAIPGSVLPKKVVSAARISRLWKLVQEGLKQKDHQTLLERKKEVLSNYATDSKSPLSSALSACLRSQAQLNNLMKPSNNRVQGIRLHARDLKSDVDVTEREDTGRNRGGMFDPNLFLTNGSVSETWQLCTPDLDDDDSATRKGSETSSDDPVLEAHAGRRFRRQKTSMSSRPRQAHRAPVIGSKSFRKPTSGKTHRRTRSSSKIQRGSSTAYPETSKSSSRNVRETTKPRRSASRRRPSARRMRKTETISSRRSSRPVSARSQRLKAIEKSRSLPALSARDSKTKRNRSKRHSSLTANTVAECKTATAGRLNRRGNLPRKRHCSSNRLGDNEDETKWASKRRSRGKRDKVKRPPSCDPGLNGSTTAQPIVPRSGRRLKTTFPRRRRRSRLQDRRRRDSSVKAVSVSSWEREIPIVSHLWPHRSTS